MGHFGTTWYFRGDGASRTVSQLALWGEQLYAWSPICWSSPVALTTLKSLDAEIKLLEAQKKLVEKRDGEVPKALAVLQRYAKVLTLAQRRQVARIIGEIGEVAPAGGVKAARKSLKGRSLGKVAPKFQLPTGETWSGRGLTPKVFAAWAKSAEGKAWPVANEGERFPAAAASKTVGKAAKRVKRAAKKSVQKSPAKKALAKKAAKKIARKPARGSKAA